MPSSLSSFLSSTLPQTSNNTLEAALSSIDVVAETNTLTTNITSSSAEFLKFKNSCATGKMTLNVDDLDATSIESPQPKLSTGLTLPDEAQLRSNSSSTFDFLSTSTNPSTGTGFRPGAKMNARPGSKKSKKKKEKGSNYNDKRQTKQGKVFKKKQERKRAAAK